MKPKRLLGLLLCLGAMGGCATTKQVVDLGFTSSSFIVPPAGTAHLSELDAPPVVTAPAEMKYPPELASTGTIGLVGGFVILQRDGKPKQIEVTYGNNRALETPARAYVRSWTFSVPQKAGQPVGTGFYFEFLIAEHRMYGPFLTGLKMKPDVATEPVR